MPFNITDDNNYEMIESFVIVAKIEMEQENSTCLAIHDEQAECNQSYDEATEVRIIDDDGKCVLSRFD